MRTHPIRIHPATRDARAAATIAILGSCILAAPRLAIAASAQDAPSPPDPLAPTEDYLPLNQHGPRLPAVVAAADVLRNYVRHNPDVTFKIGDATSVTGLQRVDLRLNGQNVGFLMLRDGELERGSVDGQQILPRPDPSPNPDSRFASHETPAAPPHRAEAAPAEAQPLAQTPSERSPQSPQVNDDAQGRVAPAMPPVTAEPAGRSRQPRAALDLPSSTRFELSEWLPPTGGLGLAWIAVVLILALTLRTTRWLSLRNLDGLVLAGTCILLLMRFMGGAASQGPQWWAYILLTAAALYWVIRGLLLARAESTPFHGGNVSGGGMLVMFVFALAVAFTQVATAPISSASRDGLVGGAYTAATGRLPYGQTPGYDEHSPLLYLLHAGAVKAVPARAVDASGNRIALQWDHRSEWLRDGWWQGADLNAARLVNGLLLVAAVAGLFMAGRSLHSGVMGLTLATIFCIFPGSVECMSRPDVMLAAALLAWAVAFATFERGAGLLAMLFIVLAGLAWPWAWLGVPVLLGYFLRRGWDGFGAVGGTLIGAAAALALVVLMTKPAIPRADGAVAAAGLQKRYTATVTDGTVVIDRFDRSAEPAAAAGFIERQRQAVWRWLLGDRLTLAQAEKLSVSMPSGVAGGEIGFHEVEPSGQAEQRLGAAYAELPRLTMPLTGRAQVALRTALEATWLPVQPDPPPAPPVWDVLAAANSSMDPMQSRRWAKVAAGVLTLFVAVLLLARAREVHQAVGGLLAVIAMALLVSMTGAVANLALLLPALLPVLAVNHAEAPRMAASERMPPPPIRLGREPRISVER